MWQQNLVGLRIQVFHVRVQALHEFLSLVFVHVLHPASLAEQLAVDILSVGLKFLNVFDLLFLKFQFRLNVFIHQETDRTIATPLCKRRIR